MLLLLYLYRLVARHTRVLHRKKTTQNCKRQGMDIRRYLRSLPCYWKLLQVPCAFEGLVNRNVWSLRNWKSWLCFTNKGRFWVCSSMEVAPSRHDLYVCSPTVAHSWQWQLTKKMLTHTGTQNTTNPHIVTKGLWRYRWHPEKIPVLWMKQASWNWYKSVCVTRESFRTIETSGCVGMGWEWGCRTSSLPNGGFSQFKICGLATKTIQGCDLMVKPAFDKQAQHIGN